MLAEPVPWVVPAALETVLGIHLRQLPHARRVSLLTRALAPLRAVPPAHAALAGALHDVGKIWVPAAVLHKESGLTGEERWIVNQHPLHGERFIRQYWPGAPGDLLDAVLHHHERPGGRGYPHGLVSLAPLTEIVALADAYDAMRERRVYRSGLSHRVALQELWGMGFSADLLDTLAQAGD